MSATDADDPSSVTVVICAFTERRWRDLRAAVDALRRQTRAPHQVVVVVDHNDALLARARSAWEPDVEVVGSQWPPGLSGARNTGVDHASGALIAFLDDDATPRADWLEHLTSPFADPRVVAVGGAAVPRWDRRRPRWWPAEFDWVVGCTYRGMPEGGGEVRNVLGATMAFRAHVFADGERFSPLVGRTGSSAAGCEETELCIRIRQRDPGARIVFEPRAVVHHRVTVDRARLSYFARRTYAEGRSKAGVTGLVGAHDALSTERSYVARTLPTGVAHGLTDTVRHGDVAGTLRAGAIGLGLLLTATGYVLGRAGRIRETGPVDDEADFTPIALMQLELTDPTPPARVPGRRRARVLVRRDGRPVGAADVPLDDGRLRREDEVRIRAELADVQTSPDATDTPDQAGAGPAVSVVIATHDRPHQLARCLDSVLATGHPGLRVIVVDNAPSTAATQHLLQRDYPTVTALREDVPGLGRAHNVGLRQVDTPVVAFTDDDVVVDRDWVSRLARPFTSGRVGCVTGLIWPAELETPGQVLIEAHGGFGKGFTTRTFDLDGSRPDDPLFPYTAGRLGSGANMAFRTDVLRALGGFDPALGAGTGARGGDDLAAFVDVIEAGHTLVYEPSAIVYHCHRRDVDDARAQALNYGIGLAAYLTRTAARRPSTLVTFVRLAPRAVAHLTGSSASLVSDGVADRGDRLLLWQLAGLARGPFAYARSVRDARRTPLRAA